MSCMGQHHAQHGELSMLIDDFDVSCRVCRRTLSPEDLDSGECFGECDELPKKILPKVVDERTVWR